MPKIHLENGGDTYGNFLYALEDVSVLKKIVFAVPSGHAVREDWRKWGHGYL